MRKKLDDVEKKIGITITINQDLNKIISNNYKNKSKYFERLVYNDLLKNKMIDKDFIV
jgi:hypothetical protein